MALILCSIQVISFPPHCYRVRGFFDPGWTQNWAQSTTRLFEYRDLFAGGCHNDVGLATVRVDCLVFIPAALGSKEAECEL
jgi:hypothetical protein